MEAIYELWGKRNPEFEKRYQEAILDVFCDYGRGVNRFQDVRGKIFGAGYEVYIIAFFIGLYFDQVKPLVADNAKRKVLGQPIMYWGNIEERAGRRAYGKIREYIFENISDHRCRNGSTIINSLWIMDNTHSQNRRVLCRRKSNKRRNVFFCASRKRL